MARKSPWTKTLKKGAYSEWVKRMESKHKVKIFNEDGTIPVDFSRRICESKSGKIKWHNKIIEFDKITKKRACAAIALRKMNKDKKKKTHRVKRKR